MKRLLPPFAALKAFESTARLGSFKHAAKELHRTQSAISHQVKQLEEFLDTSLFDRDKEKSAIRLTSQGKDYYREITEVLDHLSTATHRTRGESLSGPLMIGATPAFMSRWFLPRMGDFYNIYPEISLEIVSIDQPLAFPDSGIDILIQYGSEPADGFRVEPFLTTTRFPVCSPTLIEKNGEFTKPSDLLEQILLKDEYGDSWQEWFEAAEGKLPEKVAGPVLPHCELTLRAAKAGQGVVLGYGALIEKELASGELIRLFDIETRGTIIYSLTYPESEANRPKIAAFRNWIFDQVRLPRDNRVTVEQQISEIA